ncbi:hypothetical protein BDW59DRAFT_155882 [Aspergillus cavernicola]|uniref:methylated diphthine methylhydrolase n=1 Tax=Aspergillus cavernicola TaxID=176166 RepID=A0ABR4J4T1_9EURO
MAPQTPSSSTTIYLHQPPSCLQFCPTSPNSLVIGTYLLSETKGPETDTEGVEIIHQAKTGSLQLWNLHPETDTLSQITRLEINAAVFDLQFHPRNPKVLGIATSDASVSLFTVSETGFTHLWTRSVHEDPSIPALFLAWMPEFWLDPPQGKGGDGFAVTFSDGRTGVFGLDDSNTNTDTNDEGKGEEEKEEITELETFNATQPIEVWFVALATYQTLTPGQPYQNQKKTTYTYTPYLFTGTDFGALQTIRFPDHQPQPTTSPVTDNDNDNNNANDNLPPPTLSTTDKARHHTAGITSILPLPLPLHATNGAPLLLTGSYDESIRIYHATGRGGVIAEMGVGGGVWRLKVLSSTSSITDTNSGLSGDGKREWTFLILASCMHGGVRVVRVWVSSMGDGEGEVEGGIEVLAEFKEHESMNYASDVWKCGRKNEESELRVVSSSFYDRRVCVWRVQV